MFCTECGSKLDGETVCPQCGTPVEGAVPVESVPAEATPETAGETAPEMAAIPAAEIVPAPVSDPVPAPVPNAAAGPDPVEQARLAVRAGLAGVFANWRYLVSAVMFLVGAVIAFGGTAGGKLNAGAVVSLILNWILPVLQLIAMFVTYVDALRKEKFTGRGLGLFSGVFKVKTILGWIGTAVFVACALLFFLAPGFTAGILGNIAVMPTAGPMNTASRGAADPAAAANWIMVAVGVVCVLCAVVTLLLTLFYYRGQSKMAKSVLSSLNSGEYVVTNVKGVRFWSLIQGIASIIVAVSAIAMAITLKSGIVAAFGLLCSALSHLFYHSWMKKCFRTRKEMRRVGEVPGL